MPVLLRLTTFHPYAIIITNSAAATPNPDLKHENEDLWQK
jgi:hypothetical protein